MLLIIVLGLIDSSALVSSKCGHVSPKAIDFDWNKLGVSELTKFMYQAVVKTSALVYISFVVTLTNSQ